MIKRNNVTRTNVPRTKWTTERTKNKPLDILVTEKEVERILAQYDADIASELLTMKQEIEWLKMEVRRLKGEDIEDEFDPKKPLV